MPSPPPSPVEAPPSSYFCTPDGAASGAPCSREENEAQLEPRALKFPLDDKSSKAWRADPARMALLADTRRPGDVDPDAVDAIYFTGGHGVMHDFPDCPGLQAITRRIWENGVVSSVCHGYCGLLNVTLTNGAHLVAGRNLTGFSWTEEVLARVDKLVPYNVEQQVKDRGALYHKAKLPFVPHVITDGRLITGQNPASAKDTAQAVAAALSR